MSLKKIEQVKADKGFKIWDLIIYGVIAVLVAVLFIVIFTTRNNDPLTGVKITVAGDTVFEYEFTSQPTYSDKVEIEENDKSVTVKITSPNGDLNVVYIDKSAKTVKMIEANCKGGECKFFPLMDNNSKFIYCSPHALKVEPLVEKDLDGPIKF